MANNYNNNNNREGKKRKENFSVTVKSGSFVGLSGPCARFDDFNSLALANVLFIRLHVRQKNQKKSFDFGFHFLLTRKNKK